MKHRIFLDGHEKRPKDGKLLFCGYINYNHELLYNSDAETVIDSILESDSIEKLLEDINGSFRFIYHKNQKLYFSIDHFGGYTLFYKINASGISIFDNPMQYEHQSKLNDAALCSIFAAGFTLNDDTIFEGIKECIPGILYTYDFTTGKLSTDCWFAYISTDSNMLNYSELDEILTGLFFPVKGGEYMLSLSGGIDSRFLLANLLKKDLTFKAFSFGTDQNEDKTISQKLASSFNIPFTKFDFTPEICLEHFTAKDIDYIINNCTLGRSLPNETDLISSYALNPKTDIICKGYGGDYFAGRYITPTVHKLKSFEQAVNYLFEKYFSLTCISGNSYHNLLYAGLVNSIQALYKQNHKNIISTIEQWNLLHNERKYIVNTLAFYKAQGYRFYLPFYDRRLVTYMSQLRFTEKNDQKAYFRYLREHFFTGKLQELKSMQSLRPNFLSEINSTYLSELTKSLHATIRKIDKQKIRKRFVTVPPKQYADTLMLFTQSMQVSPYLKNKISHNFPGITETAGFLKHAGCTEAAKHLCWLSTQETIQMNVNGLSLCKFFCSPEFINAIEKQKPTNNL